MDDAARAELRERARLLYADPAYSVRAIELKLGVERTRLYRWAREMSWPLRSSNPAVFGIKGAAGGRTRGPRTPRSSFERFERRRLAIVDRIYTGVELALEELERQMSENDPANPRDPAREAQILGNLTRTADKAKDLEPEHAKRNPAPAAGSASARPRPTREQEEDVRRRIVEQVARLRERQRHPRRPD
jgi:hypothetical protein